MKKMVLICALLFPMFLFAEVKLNRTQAADGAIKVATWLLVEKKDQNYAEKFLKYALARYPESRSALLFQARLKKDVTSIKLGTVTDKDIETYHEYLLTYAIRGKTSDVKLLHYRLISFIDESDEDTLIALTKASNDKIDTDYDVLHEKVFGKKKEEIAEVEKEKIIVKSEREEAKEAEEQAKREAREQARENRNDENRERAQTQC